MLRSSLCETDFVFVSHKEDGNADDSTAAAAPAPMSGAQKARFKALQTAIEKDRVKGDKAKWLKDYNEYIGAGGQRTASFEQARIYYEVDNIGQILDHNQELQEEEVTQLKDDFIGRVSMNGIELPNLENFMAVPKDAIEVSSELV